MRSSRRIFRRFMIVALGINALVGAATVAYDVLDVFSATKEYLRLDAESAAATAGRLRRERPRAPLSEVVARAAALTGRPMALLDEAGRITFASDPRLPATIGRVYGSAPPDATIHVEIRDDLGPLSGGWKVFSFAPGRRLLVIAPRLPSAEGKVRYVTLGAGVVGLGLLLSFVIFLAAANWMVHRPLSREVAGRTRALVRDVQQRRRAEEEAVRARNQAEETLAFQENLIDASNWMGIIATGADGRVAIYNRAAEEILGRPAAEVEQRATLEALLGPPVGGRQESIHAGGPAERLVQRGDGEARRIALNVSEIRDTDGAHRGHLAVFVDVTERRRLEEELRVNELQLLQSAKMASLGEMATGIAHELNQPLNHIGILASRMRRRSRGLPEETAAFFTEKLARLEGQVQRAGRIIDQLRAFGHPDPGEVTAVRVGDRVQSVLDLMGQQLRKAGVTLAVSLPAGLPPARANPAHLEQILVNLLVNARDALRDQPPAGEPPRITITARSVPAPGGARVRLEVSDNGPGIPPGIAARIFEPFFTTKEVGKGTGLGLAISYSLVRGFGATLSVSSPEGGGTTFTIEMATAAAAGAAGAA